MASWPGFVGGSYTSRASMLAGERAMNCYPARLQGEAASLALMLAPVPGTVDFATLTDAPIRALWVDEQTSRLFAVAGRRLVEVVENGTPTVRGTVLVDTNPASLASNGENELLVVSGTRGDVLNLTTGVFTTGEVSAVTMAGAIDTFLLGLDGATGTLKISEAGDALTWDPTQVAQRSAAPDPWQAMAVARGEIVLIGASSGEVWYNKGSSPFPFALRAGSVFDIGIAAAWSLTLFGGSVAWVGRHGRTGALGVYWLNGYTPVPISTDAVDWSLLQARETVGMSDAVGWSYGRMGQEFYVLELPKADLTWVYERATGRWHQRGKWDVATGVFGAYRPRYHVDAFEFSVVGDRAAGRLYKFSETVYTDVGSSVLRRERRVPLVSTEHRRRYLDYVELECQRGVGLQAGQGSDPQVMLRVSVDGGQTWGTERTRGIGKVGQYGTRVRWPRCGSGLRLGVEIAATDPVATYWGDLYVGLS